MDGCAFDLSHADRAILVSAALSGEARSEQAAQRDAQIAAEVSGEAIALLLGDA
jgi:hypothetical protein